MNVEGLLTITWRSVATAIRAQCCFSAGKIDAFHAERKLYLQKIGLAGSSFHLSQQNWIEDFRGQLEILLAIFYCPVTSNGFLDSSWKSGKFS